MLRFIVFALVLLAAPSAFAQCNPNIRGGVPFSCTPGNTPSPNDVILGGSKTGNTAGQTVIWTFGQMLSMDHSGSPVTATNGTSKTLSGWMDQLQAFATTPITVGGQAVSLGGATANQGNGPKISLASGNFTAGNCRQTDANGNEVDSGGPCGGGSGGSGSVTSGAANQLAWYASTGTAVTGLATANLGVLGTSGSGVPSISSTLPTGLAIPSPTISSPTISGTLNATGRIAAAASTSSQAGLNIGQGTAPSTPANGDIWLTTAGVSARVNGATVSLSGGAGGGLSSVTASAPLAGAGTSGSPLTCVTCATTTNGGALSATAPMAISTAGVISLGTQAGAALVQWPTNTTVAADTYYYSLAWPWATGTITNVVYATGGTSPSFSIAVQVNGSSVTGCSGLTVTSSTATTANCTAANAVTKGQRVTLAVSAVSGTPNAAQVQISYTRSAN